MAIRKRRKVTRGLVGKRAKNPKVHQPSPTDIKEVVKILELSIPGNPVAHGRPRFSRGRVYNPSKTTEFKQKVSFLMSAQYHQPTDYLSKFRVDINFYRANRQRIDVDNLSKSILDAITNMKLWGDDSQLQELRAIKFLNCDNPKTDVIIYLVDDNSPKPLCPICGKQVINYYKSNNVKFCSLECSHQAVRVTLKCEGCGNFYTIPKSLAKKRKTKTCSKICSNLVLKRKAELRPKRYICRDCGLPITKKQYKRCIKCSMKRRFGTGKGKYFKNISC